MGFESFQLALRGGRLKPKEILREVLKDPAVTRDRGFLSDSDFLLRNDGLHKIEMEIDRDQPRLSMRFALCHPASIDDAFLLLVNSYRTRFGMEFEGFCDSPPSHTLSVDQYLRQQIADERGAWQLQIGTDTAAATTEEAFAWFILPRCVPAEPLNGRLRQTVPPTQEPVTK